MTGEAISAVELTVAGQPWAATGQRLLAVRVASLLGQPAQCELSLSDVAGGWPAGWPLGTALEVRVDGDDHELFVGEVTCVEMVRGPGPVTGRVRAYDPLHRLRKRQRQRVFTDVTAAEIARELVADLSLDVVADGAGPHLDRVVQHRQTDFDLLTEVASGAGLYPVVRGREMRLVTLAGYGEPMKLHLGVSLWEARVEANLDRVATRVTAIGWDTGRAEALRHEATDARSGRRIGLSPDPHTVGGTGEATLVDQPGASADTVAGLAQAALDASAARAVTLSGSAAGSAALVAGARVGIFGLDDLVDGEYAVCGATHTLDGTGYHTTFTTQPPELEAAPASSSLTLGSVTDVNDPDGLGRVRISLPALGDLDVGWLGVLCLGAGPNKGLVVLPDVGDRVVVALAHQSPSHGVVLGSLFGTVTPPDPGVSGNAVQRWSMHTADGQSIVVDDGEHRIRLENRAGSFVELSPDVLRLHATTDLMIDAPGHAMTVRAASIDFEHAPLPVAL